MALTSEFIYVYTIQCDGCLKRTRPAFHRIVAIARAKRAGYERFELGEKKEITWFCKPCLTSPHVQDWIDKLKVPPIPQVIQTR